MTGLTLTASNAVDTCPKGQYAGTIKNLEIVEQRENSQFGDGPQLRITVLIRRVVFATPNPPNGEPRESDQPEWWVGKDVWAFANPVLGKNSKLRPWVEAVLGRTLRDDEEVDLYQMMGKQVVITMGRTSTGRHKVTDFVLDSEAEAANAAKADAPAPAPNGIQPRQRKELVALGFEDAQLDGMTRAQAAKLIQQHTAEAEADEDAPTF